MILLIYLTFALISWPFLFRGFMSYTFKNSFVRIDNVDIAGGLALSFALAMIWPLSVLIALCIFVWHYWVKHQAIEKILPPSIRDRYKP